MEGAQAVRLPHSHRGTGERVRRNPLGILQGLRPEQIEQGIRTAKEAGLRVVATVIIGLPEDSAESIKETMKLVRKVGPDFVSYNLAVPRNLTELRKTVLSEGLASKTEMDQAGSFAAARTRKLGEKELISLKQAAVRDFYLRPGYLAGRLAKVGSGFELYALFREGLAVLGKNI